MTINWDVFILVMLFLLNLSIILSRMLKHKWVFKLHLHTWNFLHKLYGITFTGKTSPWHCDIMKWFIIIFYDHDYITEICSQFCNGFKMKLQDHNEAGEMANILQHTDISENAFKNWVEYRFKRDNYNKVTVEHHHSLPRTLSTKFSHEITMNTPVRHYISTKWNWRLLIRRTMLAQALKA